MFTIRLKFICIFITLFSFLYGDSFIFDLSQLTETPPENWYQTGERWTFQDRDEANRDEILALLEEMGWFEAKYASKMHYDYALVFGALHVAVKNRIGHLINEWDRGVRFDSIVFLTGERPLIPEKEPGFSGTEADMMVQVWEEASLPKELRMVPLIVIDAPPLPERGRPTTESTLLTWIEQSPTPGSCLFFSSQPFVYYQDAIVKQVIPSSFETETIGPKGGRGQPISVLLDNVAKWLYWSTL